MNTEIGDIMERLEPDELERLLKGVDEKRPDAGRQRSLRERLAAATGVPARERGLRLPRRAWLAAAACLVLVIGMGIGGYAYAAEAKEYKEAVMFFAENGLSSEGLTRGEIKAVYRDITTESFTYGKTAEVIAHNMETNHIEGWELVVNDPDPADVKTVWKQLWERYQSEILYFCDWREARTVENGAVHVSFKEGTFTKCIGNEPIWTYTSGDMRFYYDVRLSEGVLGVGAVTTDYEFPQGGVEDDSERRYMPAISRLTDEGELVWFASWDNGCREEQISSVVENEDGSLTVISCMRDYVREEFAVCVTRLGAGGENLGSVITPVGSAAWVCDAIAFDGGYLAVLYDLDRPEQRVIRIDADGALANEYSYSEDGREYRIRSIAVYEGRIYISAYTLDSEYLYDGLNERFIAGETIPDEEYTERVKNAYTAVLLVTDGGGGEPRVFYEVKGSQAVVPLRTESGMLVWTVQTAVTAHFTPIYSSRAADMTVAVHEFLIGPDGVVSEREVGEPTMAMNWE